MNIDSDYMVYRNIVKYLQDNNGKMFTAKQISKMVGILPNDVVELCNSGSIENRSLVYIAPIKHFGKYFIKYYTK